MRPLNWNSPKTTLNNFLRLGVTYHCQTNKLAQSVFKKILTIRCRCDRIFRLYTVARKNARGTTIRRDIEARITGSEAKNNCLLFFASETAQSKERDEPSVLEAMSSDYAAAEGTSLENRI